jgi:hypothetical protein
MGIRRPRTEQEWILVWVFVGFVIGTLVLLWVGGRIGVGIP